MVGNVWEWTLDEYENSYSGAPSNGDARCNASDCSKNANQSARRVLRGSGWYHGYATSLCAANRDHSIPSNRNTVFGGRVVKSVSLKN